SELNFDVSNWWAPNVKALEGLCRAAGFRRVEVIYRPEAAAHPPTRAGGGGIRGRAIAHARKWPPAPGSPRALARGPGHEAPMTTAPREAHTGDLTATLAALLDRHLGRPVRVAGIERQRSAYSSSFALDELEVRLEDGTAVSLVLKDLSRSAILEGARRA